MDESNHSELIALTATIVSAHVSNNTIAPSDLTGLIGAVHKALAVARTGAATEPQVPAVTVRKSISPDYLICLEDGRKFKSLKRHLRINHDLTPRDYRAKWGLNTDYPMVAPNYAAVRSALAKRIGLGQGGRRAALAKAPSSRPPPRRRKGTTTTTG